MRLLTLTMVLLSGCAATAMTQNECRSTNWYERGEREALMGARPQIELYQHQCTRFGAAPSEKEYMDGWNVGWGEYSHRVSGKRG